MTRFALYSPKEKAPSKTTWPPLRIFAWACLWGAMLFWAWVFIAGRG